MAISNRKLPRKKLSENEQAENHPLFPFIQKARACIEDNEKDKFNSLLNTLHYIAGEANQQGFAVKRRSEIEMLINGLFKDAKEKFSNQERLNEIRMMQAAYFEKMGEGNKALMMFDSLAKHASTPLRWSAINSRTWLIQTTSQKEFEQGKLTDAVRSCEAAIASAYEVINAYDVLKDDTRPSVRRYRDALDHVGSTIAFMRSSLALTADQENKLKNLYGDIDTRRASRVYKPTFFNQTSAHKKAKETDQKIEANQSLLIFQ